MRPLNFLRVVTRACLPLPYPAQGAEASRIRRVAAAWAVAILAAQAGCAQGQSPWDEAAGLLFDGQPQAAVERYDALVAAAPDVAPALWQRGIAQYYAGQFDAGRRQFELHRTVNPDDVENAAWHFACVARSAGAAAAREALLPVGPDPRVPMQEILDLYAGKLQPADVLAAAERGPEPSRRNRLCYAHLYLGLYFEALGDASQAQRHMQLAAGPFAENHFMGRVAQLHTQLRGWTTSAEAESAEAKPASAADANADPSNAATADDAGQAAQSHWPRFRGPRADGVTPDHPQLPEVWDAATNVAWQADVPGLGWSSPIVWGDKVVITTVASDESAAQPKAGLYQGEGVRDPAPGIHHWLVLCYDLQSGQLLWQREVHTGEPQAPRHPKSSYAAETPCTDGQRVYALFGDVGLYALDLATGDLVWEQPIEYRKTLYDYGAASSPVVHDGSVFVVYDNMEESWIAAFDAATGALQWKEPRDETHSWSTPFVWEHTARTELVVPGQKQNRGYALDGTLLWHFDGRMSNLVIPSPFAAHGLCYIASGYIGDVQRPTFAIRPGGSGDLAADAGSDFSGSEYIAWYRKQASPYNTTQLVYGDYLYTLYDQGFMTCHDARTGEEVYGKKRFQPSGSFTAAPWAYNGYVFCLSEDGRTYVVQAGPEFRMVATNPLDALCLATPAAVGDRLLVRTAKGLYCFRGGARAASVADREQPPLDLWTAAREGDVAAVRAALDAGATADARPAGGGEPPLAIASLLGRTEVVRLLLDRGAAIDQPSFAGNAPLHLAAFLGHTETVALLLERGASTSVKNGEGLTAGEMVGAPWSDAIEARYRLVENLLGIELDLEQIQQRRPEIAQLIESRK